MDCQDLRDEKHIKMGDCQNLRETLAKDKHLSIIFTNVAKDGSLYFIDTIVYPISNIDLFLQNRSIFLKIRDMYKD